jgi:hypothetical protein
VAPEDGCNREGEEKMNNNAGLEQLLADFRAAVRRLQPLLQRPLTREENALRTSIIRDELLPIRNQIIQIDGGLCQG